jgi:hypothetical protein
MMALSVTGNPPFTHRVTFFRGILRDFEKSYHFSGGKTNEETPQGARLPRRFLDCNVENRYNLDYDET